MTAATITRPADAVLIDRLRAVYDRATTITAGKPETARNAIEDASWQFKDAIDFYELIHNGQVAPLSAYGELHYRCIEDQLYAEALRMAAADAAEEAGELVKVIAEHCGDGIARRVSGEEGGVA